MFPSCSLPAAEMVAMGPECNRRHVLFTIVVELYAVRLAKLIVRLSETQRLQRLSLSITTKLTIRRLPTMSPTLATRRRRHVT